MGNWTCSAAASSYIDTSEVTMRANGAALSMPECFYVNPNVFLREPDEREKEPDVPVPDPPVILDHDERETL